jgi:hypothetical protein
VGQRRGRRDGPAGRDLGRGEARQVAAVEALARGAVGEHLPTLRVGGGDDDREALQVGAQDLRRAERVVGDQSRLDARARGAVGDGGEEPADAAGEPDLRQLRVEEEARDAEPLERRELHVCDQQRPGREILLEDGRNLRHRAEPDLRHRPGAEPHEARAGRADHAEVGQVADEREHVRDDRPERHVAPALEAEQRLADRVVEDGQGGARAERVCLLADSVDLVRAREARDGREALVPRAVVAALGRPELEDEVHATSTGAPDAAEA